MNLLERVYVMTVQRTVRQTKTEGERAIELGHGRVVPDWQTSSVGKFG